MAYSEKSNRLQTCRPLTAIQFKLRFASCVPNAVIIS